MPTNLYLVRLSLIVLFIFLGGSVYNFVQADELENIKEVPFNTRVKNETKVKSIGSSKALVSMPSPAPSHDCGTALLFDGTNDYVALQLFESGANSLPQFTTEAWIKTTFTGGDFDNWSILDFDRSEFFNVFITGNGQLGFSSTAEGNPIHDMYSGTTGSLNDGNWHHIAVVYDGTDKIAYADGVEIGRAINAHGGDAIGTSSTRYAFIGDGSEASSFNANRNNNYYDGTVDEVRYWSTARTASEVSTNINSVLSGTETGLVAYYDFNDGVGSSVLTDKATGNRGANDGSLFNMDNSTAWVSVNLAPSITCPGDISETLNLSCEFVIPDYTPGVTVSDDCSSVEDITIIQTPEPGAIVRGNTTIFVTAIDEFGESNSCSFELTFIDDQNPSITCSSNITVDNTPGSCDVTLSITSPEYTDDCGTALLFDGSNDYVALQLFESGANTLPQMTAEAWINTTFTGAGNFDNWAILDFDRSEFFNVFISGSGQLGFSSTASGSSTHNMYSGSTGSLNDGNWHHIAVVYDGTDKIAYADGVEIGRASNPHGGNALGTGNARYAFLGDGSEAASFNSSRNNIYYEGALDEVRYWSTARTASDINSYKNVLLTGSESGLVAYYDFNDGTGSSTLADKATANRGANDGTLFNMDNSTAWIPEMDLTSLTLTNSYTGTDDASGTYPIGTTDIIWTVTDEAGNFSSCLQTVTVNELHSDADCDGDGFTNAEEQAGICGFIGDSFDYNSPFKWQETNASGTTDDQIFQLEQVEITGDFEGGETVHLTVKSGHNLTLNSSIMVRNLVVEAGASIDLNGNRLQVRGDLTINGDFTHNLGYFHMRGNCEQNFISGNNPLSMHGLILDNPHGIILETDLFASGPIQPEDGVFDLNSHELILTSSPIDGDIITGSISEIKSGADVIGDITIQRYVESTEEGYRLLGPPIKDQTVADISDDFVSTGFVGSDWPNQDFTNLKYYKEDQRTDGSVSSGFKDVLNANEPLVPDHGYWAYFPPSATANVLEVTGEFNKGEVTCDLSYTNTGVPANDGWNCIRNPYPSAIDLESGCISFDNVSQAVYILDQTLGSSWTGEYVVYNNGISVNGGTEVIASFQAFMIQATGPNASITFNECAKTDEQGIFYRNSGKKNYIRLALQRGEEHSYETVIAFDENASVQFDPEFDARKFESDVYSLASVGNEELLTINTVPNLNEDLSIPLSVSIPEAGEYKLLVSELVNVEVNACLFIEDTTTGEMTPVTENTELLFTIDDEEYLEERFIFHARSEVEVTTTKPQCAGTEDGSALVTIDSESEATFKWSDTANVLLLEDTGNSSELTGMPSGTYYVRIDNSESICTSSTLEVEIEPVLEQVVEINSTPDYCSSETASLKVAVENTETFSVELLREYEVVATETSDSLLMLEGLEGGIYDVIVITDCITEEYVIDLSDPREVKAKFEAPSDVLLENVGAEIEVEAISENADDHEWFLDEYFQGNEEVISMTFDEVGSYRLKLNSSNKYCTDSYEQDIVVSAATVITENLEKDFLTINRPSEINIIRLNDGTGEIDVVLYDIKGSKIVEHLAVTASELTINKEGLSNGVYILNITTEDGHLLSTKYAK
ncbi:MAG: LamG-like jellyroll fold domain-containing protein [Flavobacteriales bacterium]